MEIERMIMPIILSGGSGTRLWPLSRELYPKQLLPLVGETTMLQETVTRLHGVKDLTAPMVVCNEGHRFLVAEQLRQIGVDPQAILLEPAGRNTAPAVAVAAITAISDSDDAILLVLPADHVIKDTRAFHRSLHIAAAAAEAGKLVTFGVVPTRPETGYGYIKKVEGRGAVFLVEKFVEKPGPKTAEDYFRSGQYLWNSGMFMFRASVFLSEMRKYAPEIYDAVTLAVTGSEVDLDFIRLESDAFLASPSDSIDYAVMEKTEQAVVVPLEAGWSDVGSWSALHEACDGDSNNNVMKGDVACVDTSDCYLYSSDRLVATVGLEGHVVVETKDAVLVAPKDKVQNVKNLVDSLKADQRGETSLHREVFRPWGSYDSVDQGERFQVKRLVVNPGAVLSLQMHHHRAEHWVVVSGTAKITRNDEEFLLRENESTYIPIGATHRIENPGTLPLHIIEVQSGSYLGEDDIVRFEDNYGREGTNT